jgi:hypothetical protein
MPEPDREPETIDVDLPATTAPVFPTEHVLSSSQVFFQRMIGGGMQLKFVAVIMSPRGPLPAPEATVINLTPDGWEVFKRIVAADGVVPPQVETALHIPGGLLNGEPH